MRDLPAPSLYQACVRGLKTINPDVVFNSTMPRGNAAKVNVCGGAISIGHPFGMTGSRQVDALPDLT